MKQNYNLTVLVVFFFCCCIKLTENFHAVGYIQSSSNKIYHKIIKNKNVCKLFLVYKFNYFKLKYFSLIYYVEFVFSIKLYDVVIYEKYVACIKIKKTKCKLIRGK